MDQIMLKDENDESQNAFIVMVRPSYVPWTTSMTATAARSITSSRCWVACLLRRRDLDFFIYLVFARSPIIVRLQRVFFSGWTQALSGITFRSASNVLCALIINGESSGDQAGWDRLGLGSCETLQYALDALEFGSGFVHVDFQYCSSAVTLHKWEE